MGPQRALGKKERKSKRKKPFLMRLPADNLLNGIHSKNWAFVIANESIQKLE